MGEPRELFTIHQLRASGLTDRAVHWRVHTGQLTRLWRGVYGSGPDPGTSLDRARAIVLGTGGAASGTVAGELLGLDGVTCDGPDVTLPPSYDSTTPGVRRRRLDPARLIEVDGLACTDALQTFCDLAARLSDDALEWVLEDVLRRGVPIDEIAAAIVRMGRRRTPGTVRARRVLERRPPGAAPTESLLETMFVQLVASIPGLDQPERQVEILDDVGNVIARLDFLWRRIGLGIEVNGSFHLGQRGPDNDRIGTVSAKTGLWIHEFWWDDIVRRRVRTARRLLELIAQAEARPWANPAAAFDGGLAA